MGTLQVLRESRGWTRNQLAAATGGVVDVSTIYRIEEKGVEPKTITRKVLADALGVTVDAIEWPKRQEGASSGE